MLVGGGSCSSRARAIRDSSTHEPFDPDPTRYGDRRPSSLQPIQHLLRMVCMRVRRGAACSWQHLLREITHEPRAIQHSKSPHRMPPGRHQRHYAPEAPQESRRRS